MILLIALKWDFFLTASVCFFFGWHPEPWHRTAHRTSIDSTHSFPTCHTTLTALPRILPRHFLAQGHLLQVHQISINTQTLNRFCKHAHFAEHFRPVPFVFPIRPIFVVSGSDPSLYYWHCCFWRLPLPWNSVCLFSLKTAFSNCILLSFTLKAVVCNTLAASTTAGWNSTMQNRSINMTQKCSRFL